MKLFIKNRRDVRVRCVMMKIGECANCWYGDDIKRSCSYPNRQENPTKPLPISEKNLYCENWRPRHEIT